MKTQLYAQPEHSFLDFAGFKRGTEAEADSFIKFNFTQRFFLTEFFYLQLH